MTTRTLVLAYAAVAYLSFLVAILYAMGFAANRVVPKGMNDGPPAPSVAWAAGINTALLALFAVQHTIMARGRFKRWLVQYVPTPVERSTFVLAASLLLLLIFWQWQPIPTTIWSVTHPVSHSLLLTASLLGWVIVFYSSFLIDHFELFGLRQAWLYFRGRPYTPPEFTCRSLYHHVRHPLMLGFLIAFWATPTMTVGHLLFSGVITAYILFGVSMEERDLLRAHGASYAQYRSTTPMLIPFCRLPAIARRTTQEST
jgi:protein-S-isoprenylcysteine O-methyltransferase Ste14